MNSTEIQNGNAYNIQTRIIEKDIIALQNGTININTAIENYKKLVNRLTIKASDEELGDIIIDGLRERNPDFINEGLEAINSGEYYINLTDEETIKDFHSIKKIHIGNNYTIGDYNTFLETSKRYEAEVEKLIKEGNLSEEDKYKTPEEIRDIIIEKNNIELNFKDKNLFNLKISELLEIQQDLKIIYENINGIYNVNSDEALKRQNNIKNSLKEKIKKLLGIGGTNILGQLGNILGKKDDIKTLSELEINQKITEDNPDITISQYIKESKSDDEILNIIRKVIEGNDILEGLQIEEIVNENKFDKILEEYFIENGKNYINFLEFVKDNFPNLGYKDGVLMIKSLTKYIEIDIVDNITEIISFYNIILYILSKNKNCTIKNVIENIIKNNDDKDIHLIMNLLYVFDSLSDISKGKTNVGKVFDTIYNIKNNNNEIYKSLEVFFHLTINKVLGTYNKGIFEYLNELVENKEYQKLEFLIEKGLIIKKADFDFNRNQLKVRYHKKTKGKRSEVIKIQEIKTDSSKIKEFSKLDNFLKIGMKTFAENGDKYSKVKFYFKIVVKIPEGTFYVDKMNEEECTTLRYLAERAKNKLSNNEVNKLIEKHSAIKSFDKILKENGQKLAFNFSETKLNPSKGCFKDFAEIMGRFNDSLDDNDKLKEIFEELRKYMDYLVTLSFKRNLGREKARKENSKDEDYSKSLSISPLYRNYIDENLIEGRYKYVTILEERCRTDWENKDMINYRDKVEKRIMYLATGKSITLNDLAKKYIK